MGYEAKIAPNGRVVIPFDLRKQLGVERGGTLKFDVEGDHIVLQTVAQRVRDAQRMAADALEGFEGNTLDAFLADKEEQARRENEEHWHGRHGG